jgi:acetyl esterase/lipase
MPRFSAFVLAVGVVTAVLGNSPLSGDTQEATPATADAVPPQPPTQPRNGPGSSEVLFDEVVSREQTAPDHFQTDSWLFVPSNPLPGSPAVAEPFPLVIFIHGSGAREPDLYLAWIEHLARRGAVVLYPEYQGADTDERVYPQNLFDVVRRALKTLEREDVAIDESRVAVIGHSLGGVLAVDYAARAAAVGLPVPTAVMGVAPECSASATAMTCLEGDASTIAPTTRLLLVAEERDVETVWLAVEHLWSEISAVPLENRDIVTLTTDTHGRPPLLTTHGQADATTTDARDAMAPDAFDWYGTWKWLDALMGCAFDGEWCEYALGNTPEQRFLGTWSDGVPVTEAGVTDDPMQRSP